MKAKTVTLGSVCHLVNGKAFKSSDWSTTGVPIIRIQNLNGPDRPFNYWAGSLDNQVQVKKGDLLLAWSGTPGTSFGAHIWRGGQSILNQHIFRCDLDANAITPEWAKFAVNTQLDELIGLAHGGVGLKHVTRRVVEDLEIPLPSLAEQRRIADVLARAEVLRAKRRAALAQLDRLAKSIFLNLFGDPATNPMGWEVNPFGVEIGSVRYGTGSPPTYIEEGVPFIRATNVKEGTISSKDLKRISPQDARRLEKCKVRFGNLIVVRSGVNTGDCAMVPREYDGACAAFDLIVELSPSNAVFYNFLINSAYGKQHLAPLTRRAAQPHLNAAQLQALAFIAPPLPLREEFVCRVAAMEKLKTVYRASLADLDALFATLQYRALRGEL